jgi:predicted alpha/beta superfamily hydrolase
MSNKPLVIFAFILLIFSNHSFSKVRGESGLVTIKSDVLNEARELIIHLPNNYPLHKGVEYSVLYLLDGQRNFAHAVGTLDLLNQSKMAQEMIVVGITNTQRTRDFTPTYDENYNEWGISGGADKFLEFVEKELKPYIRKNYRTNGFDVLSGHSLGGLLSIYTLQTKPDLFQGYFAFSPSLWWHKEVLFADAEKFFANTTPLNKFLYVNMGNEGGQMLSGFERYSALLNSSNREGFTFFSDLDTSESHNTTSLAGQSLAYQKLFSSLKPSEDVIKSGISSIKEYYRSLSEKFGYKATPDYAALNHAGYIELQQDNFDGAISIFKQNVENFPYKSDAYDSLADGYESYGELDKALKMRNLALETSIIENVENNTFKTRKANLLNKIKMKQ